MAELLISHHTASEVGMKTASEEEHSGIVTLSIEVELGWGNHDTGNFERLSEDGRTERRYLSKLLDATERTRVPISFDVVGHLLLEACDGTHESPHPDGWFRGDPGTDYHTDGLFYAPDVVADIDSASVNHELCTHTFSHALFNDVSRETATWELQQAQDLSRRHLGRETSSLVPPRHHTPPYDVLSDCGISVTRPATKTQTRTKVHRFKELLAGPLPLSELRETDGVVETSCTTNPSLTAAALPSGRGTTHPTFRCLPASVRRQYHFDKLVQATERAVAEGAHLHLWCHLFDLSNAQQFRVVERYLSWLDSFRATNDVTIVTMAELPGHVGTAI